MHDREIGEKVSRRTTSFISSYNNHRTAALAVTLAELLAFGREYAGAVVRNAQALARALDAEGFTVAGKDRGFTQSHVVLVDLGSTPRGTESARLLEEAHISSSLADLPRTYPRKSVLRLGSPACTRKGMGEGEMAEVARLVRRVVLDGEDPARVGEDVAEMASAFTTVHYCF
jgi:glycine hydroxymethyltransferase